MRGPHLFLFVGRASAVLVATPPSLVMVTWFVLPLTVSPCDSDAQRSLQSDVYMDTGRKLKTLIVEDGRRVR
jgi:hypothetical protein